MEGRGLASESSDGKGLASTIASIRRSAKERTDKRIPASRFATLTYFSLSHFVANNCVEERFDGAATRHSHEQVQLFSVFTTIVANVWRTDNRSPRRDCTEWDPSLRCRLGARLFS